MFTKRPLNTSLLGPEAAFEDEETALWHEEQMEKAFQGARKWEFSWLIPSAFFKLLHCLALNYSSANPDLPPAFFSFFSLGSFKQQVPSAQEEGFLKALSKEEDLSQLIWEPTSNPGTSLLFWWPSMYKQPIDRDVVATSCFSGRSKTVRETLRQLIQMVKDDDGDQGSTSFVEMTYVYKLSPDPLAKSC